MDYIKCHFLCITLETLTWAICGRNQESKFLTRPQVILVLTVCNGYFKPYKIRENSTRLSHTHHLASINNQHRNSLFSSISHPFTLYHYFILKIIPDILTFYPLMLQFVLLKEIFFFLTWLQYNNHT